MKRVLILLIAVAMIAVVMTVQTKQTEAAPGGALTGAIYRDWNASGDRDASERGIEGVTINVYDDTNSVVATVTSDSDGNYTIGLAGLDAGQMIRVELATVPDWTRTGFGNDSRVQFVAVPATTAETNFGLSEFGKHNAGADNTTLATSCYVGGDPLLGGAAATLPTVVEFPYDPSPQYGQNTYLSEGQETGTTWGVAYDPHADTLYTSAFLRRHAGFGPDGPGAIYAIARASGAISTLATLTAGADPHTGLPAEGTSPSHDLAAYSAIGTMSLGDIDVSPDGATLYVVNLFDKTLYAIDTATGATSATADLDAEFAAEYGACTGGELRPWATGWHEGRIYVGAVCDASASQNTDDLDAMVISFAPDLTGRNGELQFDLDYGRDYVSSASTEPMATNGQWKPWNNNTAQFLDNPLNWTAPISTNTQPILSDLEWRDDGDLVVGLNDRYGPQTGSYNLAPLDPPISRPMEYGHGSGDILRACVASAGGYELEGSGSCPTKTNSNGYDEWYADAYTGGHAETSWGGMSHLPGSGETSMTAIDEGYYHVEEGSVLTLSDEQSTRTWKYTVYARATGGSTLGWLKSQGLGDLELIAPPAPITIGNRVWADADGDGVQDPSESGMAGMTVELYDSSNTLVASTTTDSSGHYLFTSVDGVQPETNYIIGVTAPAGSESPANAGTNDLHDSDGVPGGGTYTGMIVAPVITGLGGENDHSIDFGFSAMDLGDLPDTYGTLLVSNGPAHITAAGSAPHLGAIIDTEADGVPTVLANGDDMADTDDEDGLTLDGAGWSSRTFVAHLDVVADPSACVLGWLDWNEDGDFDDISELVTNEFAGSGTVDVVVSNQWVGTTYLYGRFRVFVPNADLFVASGVGLDANGCPVPSGGGDTLSVLSVGTATGGEVEDYMWIPQITPADHGDLPDSYGTISGSTIEFVPPMHERNRLDEPTLGTRVDTEMAGQPSYAADGDDVANTADEDGVTVTVSPDWIGNAQFDITLGNSGARRTMCLMGWVDWNQVGLGTVYNGVSGTLVTQSVILDTGTTTVPINITTPYTLDDNPLVYGRFRLAPPNDPAYATLGVALNRDGCPDGTAAGAWLLRENTRLSSGEIEDYVWQPARYEFGDLPDDYGTLLVSDGARHLQRPAIRADGAYSGEQRPVFLGIDRDYEADGVPTAAATGDDAANRPDEDGVVVVDPDWIGGATLALTVSADVQLPESSGVGDMACVLGWLDRNGDGDFADANETAVNDVVVFSSSNIFSGYTSETMLYTLPGGVTATDLYARFRLFEPNADLFGAAGVSLDANGCPTGSGLDVLATGAATNGEVEDYVWSSAADLGDLPDIYRTTLAVDGPIHPVSSFGLGASIDDEADGVPSDDATGDGGDEDGVTVTGNTDWLGNMTFNVDTFGSGSACLLGYVDWNGDGDFTEGDEIVANDRVTLGGSESYTVATPLTLDDLGTIYARFRLFPEGDAIFANYALTNGCPDTADAPLSFSAAKSGEVEDYAYMPERYDLGDLPDSYHTEFANNGAAHQVDSDSEGRLWLGIDFDAESDGQPTANTDGDDNGNRADEDGIRIDGNFADGNVDFIIETTGGTQAIGETACLGLFLDWNEDSDFSDTENGAPETVFTAVTIGGAESVSVATPFPVSSNRAIHGRFRLFEASDPFFSGLTLDADGCPTGTVAQLAGLHEGTAINGEVEDYKWELSPTAVALRDSTATATDATGLSSSMTIAGLALLAVVTAAVIAFTWKREERGGERA